MKELNFKNKVDEILGGQNLVRFNHDESEYITAIVNIKCELTGNQLAELIELNLITLKRSGAGLRLIFLLPRQ